MINSYLSITECKWFLLTTGASTRIDQDCYTMDKHVPASLIWHVTQPQIYGDQLITVMDNMRRLSEDKTELRCCSCLGTSRLFSLCIQHTNDPYSLQLSCSVG